MKKPCSKKLLRNTKKQERKLIEKIRMAHEAEDKYKAWHYTISYLNSFAAKLVAVDKAWQKLPSHLRNKKMDLRVIAKSLDPFKGTSEPATLHWKLKKEDFWDFRPVMAFGIENRALQYLVKRVLEAQLFYPSISVWPEGGPQGNRSHDNQLRRGVHVHR